MNILFTHIYSAATEGSLCTLRVCGWRAFIFQTRSRDVKRFTSVDYCPPHKHAHKRRINGNGIYARGLAVHMWNSNTTNMESVVYICLNNVSVCTIRVNGVGGLMCAESIYGQDGTRPLRITWFYRAKNIKLQV